MEFEQIKEIIKQVNESNIEEFSFKQHSTEINIKKKSSSTNQVVVQQSPTSTEKTTIAATPVVEVKPAVPQAEVQPTAVNTIQSENLHKITSPMVGTFYSSPSPDADNYVTKGSKVNSETTVCIVEAMKLFNEIQAEVKGEIVEILVESGQLVEYGQPLFLVRPE